MKTLFLFSKEDLNIACAEFSAVMKKEFETDQNLTICDCNEADIKKARKRLAYCNSVFQLLFSCSPEKLDGEIKKFSWNSVCKESYVLRKINCHGLEEEKCYGSMIWPKLKNPKVDLKNAATKIFITCGSRIHVGILIGETDKSYLQRQAAMKPSLHPTAISPKLAKAMVNLTGAEKTETIVDPFCGTGGILVEASLMGFKTTGCDISERMLKFAEKNLEHNRTKYWKLQNEDATKTGLKADYVVTDLPYGRNSLVTNKPEKLYLDFLMNIKKWGIKKAVIGFPDFADCKKIIKKAGFSIENEFEQYLHKNLTKNIFVLK